MTVSKPVTAKTISKDEFFYGHKACAGCGGSLAVRIALKVLGKTRLRCSRQVVCRLSDLTFLSFVFPTTQ